MNKLFVIFVIALFINGLFGQWTIQQNQDVLDDTFGWNYPTWAQLPSQGQTFRRQNQFPFRPNTAATTPTPSASVTQSAAIRQCISSCPVTTEYNPVCGTNNVNYTNPGRLSCAQMCGVRVSLFRASPCRATPVMDPQ